MLNQELFAEFVLETMPQIAIQTYNNSMTGTFGDFGIISLTFSVIVVALGVYQYGYWKFMLKVKIKEVPISVNLSIGPFIIAKYTLRHSKSHYVKLFMKLMQNEDTGRFCFDLFNKASIAQKNDRERTVSEVKKFFFDVLLNSLNKTEVYEAFLDDEVMKSFLDDKENDISQIIEYHYSEEKDHLGKSENVTIKQDGLKRLKDVRKLSVNLNLNDKKIFLELFGVLIYDAASVEAFVLSEFSEKKMNTIKAFTDRLKTEINKLEKEKRKLTRTVFFSFYREFYCCGFVGFTIFEWTGLQDWLNGRISTQRYVNPPYEGSLVRSEVAARLRKIEEEKRECKRNNEELGKISVSFM